MYHQQNMTDQDIAQILLDCHKCSAQHLTALVLESSHSHIKNEAINALQATFNHHQSISQLMNHQGWYTPLQAGQQEISKAQQVINQLPRVHGQQGSSQQIGQFATAGTYQNKSSFNENPNYY